MSNLVVQTNVLALNSHRNMKGIGIVQSKASNRLSSGYRVNTAADDAAGLAISEKMRAQIRGLDQASRNTQDGISLIQTAEGGMQEINNMVQRIRELVVQSSNDTNEHNYEGTGDRQKLQDEINQLTQEIDNMAERVEFNKKRIIDGSFSNVAEQLRNARSALDQAVAAAGVTASAAAAFTQSAAAIQASALALRVSANTLRGSAAVKLGSAAIKRASAAMKLASANAKMASANIKFASAAERIERADAKVALAAAASAAGNTASAATLIASAEAITASAKSIEASALRIQGSAFAMQASAAMIQASVAGLNASAAAKSASAVRKMASAEERMADAQKLFDKAALGSSLKIQALSAKVQALEAAPSGDSLYFQVGANSNQNVTVNIGSVKSNFLAIGNGSGRSTISVLEDSGSSITGYLDVLDVALSYVSTERSKLGAAQNRLEFTTKSLDISSENLQAAESRIRDADMAKEMMNLTKANVLQQAGVSMLAQANQNPQMVLQLLR